MGNQSQNILRVMIFGTFDGLHPGHVFVIEQARTHGRVTAIVARDENVLRIKGRLPKQPEAVRVQAIESRFPDVSAVLGDPEDFLKPLRAAKPDRILLGYDQRLPPGVTEADFGCPVQRLPAHEPQKWKSSLL